MAEIIHDKYGPIEVSHLYEEMEKELAAKDALIVELVEACDGLIETCGHDEYIPDEECDICTKAKSAIAKAREEMKG